MSTKTANLKINVLFIGFLTLISIVHHFAKELYFLDVRPVLNLAFLKHFHFLQYVRKIFQLVALLIYNLEVSLVELLGLQIYIHRVNLSFEMPDDFLKVRNVSP
jgi:hypothetical protein